MEYEKGSRSRFSGDGHEYHCLDYSPSYLLNPNKVLVLTRQQ
jgi:hypothetical protein